GIGLFAAQDKESNDRQNVKEQDGENNVVKEIVVKVAVSLETSQRIDFIIAGGIVGAGSWQNQQAGPDTLQDQRQARDATRIELRRGLEKQSVLGHGVINARAGEDQSIGAAKGRDQDGHRHDEGARAAEHGLDGRRGDAVVRGVLNFLEWQ